MDETVGITTRELKFYHNLKKMQTKSILIQILKVSW